MNTSLNRGQRLHDGEGPDGTAADNAAENDLNALARAHRDFLRLLASHIAKTWIAANAPLRPPETHAASASEPDEP